SPSPSPSPPRPRRRRRLVLLLAATAAVVVVALAVALAPLVVGLAQTTIRIATNKGELVIDNDDEDIEVTIKQPGREPVVVLVQKGTRRALELTATDDGKIQAREQGSGLRFNTTNLELSRGDKVTFKASMLLAAKPPPAKVPDVVPGPVAAAKVDKLGTLVILNRHPTAKAFVNVITFTPPADLLKEMMEGKTAPGELMKKHNQPTASPKTLEPGESWERSMEDGQYTVMVLSIPPG